jgi:lipopolysaccharide export system permease protein
MLRQLDRMLIRNYVKAYLITLFSLLGLYVVVDLFTNIDDFSSHHDTLASLLEHIGKYYAYQVPVIFDHLCEVITLLAAMFTIAWMQRNNELLPFLSAGVSTHRVIRPVLLAACALLALSGLNQELLIPRLASELAKPRDDLDGSKTVIVTQAYDRNNIMIEGETAVPRERRVAKFTCHLPADLAQGSPISLQAKEAQYIPPAPGPKPRTGGWRLQETTPPELRNWTRTDVLEPIAPGSYFLYTTDVDFESVTRSKKWFHRASTWSLLKELNRGETNRVASLAVVFHMRLTRPILGLVLVFLGLSVILRDQNRNIFISAGLCVLLCALFYAVRFGCQFLGNEEVLTPAVSAWLPVLVFGPLVLVLFDAIHT